jgi:hypothetical protein
MVGGNLVFRARPDGSFVNFDLPPDMLKRVVELDLGDGDSIASFTTRFGFLDAWHDEYRQLTIADYMTPKTRLDHRALRPREEYVADLVLGAAALKSLVAC